MVKVGKSHVSGHRMRAVMSKGDWCMLGFVFRVQCEGSREEKHQLILEDRNWWA